MLIVEEGFFHPVGFQIKKLQLKNIPSPHLFYFLLVIYFKGMFWGEQLNYFLLLGPVCLLDFNTLPLGSLWFPRNRKCVHKCMWINST